jgi:hypothetical protein
MAGEINNETFTATRQQVAAGGRRQSWIEGALVVSRWLSIVRALEISGH